jgi:uncharacterized protein YjbI with pentapeptide repeats
VTRNWKRLKINLLVGLSMIGLILSTSLTSLAQETKQNFKPNLNHVEQLMKTKNCPNCQLSGFNIDEYVDTWKKLNRGENHPFYVSGVLRNVEGGPPDTFLNSANLRNANLRGANLSRTSLNYANLSNTDLKEASFWGSSLVGANLRGADLRCTYIVSSDLSYADLRGADFTCPEENAFYLNLYGTFKGSIIDDSTKMSEMLFQKWERQNR